MKLEENEKMVAEYVQSKNKPPVVPPMEDLKIKEPSISSQQTVTSFDEDIKFDEKISSIIRYINANMTSDLYLDTLSEKFYTSKYHLLREFKKHSGYTLHKYILQKRLLLARSLLREGASTAEAFTRSGFSDYSNLIRTFKKAFGVPPGKYSR